MGESNAAEMIEGWKATHRITVITAKGQPLTEEVMLVMNEEGRAPRMGTSSTDGPAFTLEEWVNDDQPAAQGVVNGKWVCEGQATPGGANGNVVFVRVLGDQPETAPLAAVKVAGLAGTLEAMVNEPPFEGEVEGLAITDSHGEMVALVLDVPDAAEKTVARALLFAAAPNLLAEANVLRCLASSPRFQSMTVADALAELKDNGCGHDDGMAIANATQEGA